MGLREGVQEVGTPLYKKYMINIHLLSKCTEMLVCYQNLIEKTEEPAVSKEQCIAMVQCKVLKQLSILEQRKFDDEDIVADIEFLNERLQASVQDLRFV